MEDFKELSLSEMKFEDVFPLLQEKLGITLEQCSQLLSEALLKKVDELAGDLPSMAPLGDYSKMTEDKEVMKEFLRTEASKPEHWKLEMLELRKDSQLMEIMFFNKAVDDGDILKGFVFVGVSGKIRHSFVQVHG